MSLLSLASHQLRHAADLVDKIEKLKEEMSAILGSPVETAKGSKRKHKMSDAGRLAIAAAQKLRWTKTKVESALKTKKRGRRKMSAAARTKIAAAAKARWAKAKAAGKKTL